jgi:predicted Rossmann-fold nucleotide-binding protein
VRNFAVASAGEAVISIGGAFGTLSEIGFALRSGKPVIGLKTWRISEDGKSPTPMIEASTAWEAVRLALEKTGRDFHGRG